MAAISTLIRIVLAVGFCAIGLLLVLAGLYLGCGRGVALFSESGAVCVLILLIGMGVLGGARRLLRGALAAPANDVG